MVAMAVARRTLKAGADHVRPERANDANHIGQGNVVAAPLLEGFLGCLREAEICDAGEPLLDAIVAVGTQQFQGAKNPEFIEQIAAYLVLSALASVQGQLQGGHASPSGFQRQHAAVFVIRMRGGVHQAGRGMQTSQGQLESGDTRVDRQRLGVDPRGRDLRVCRRTAAPAQRRSARAAEHAIGLSTVKAAFVVGAM